MNNFEENLNDLEYRREKFYDDQIEEYFQEATKAFNRYTNSTGGWKIAIITAQQFFEDYWAALDVFAELKLKRIHALALVNEKDLFIEELDKSLEHDEMMRYYE
jgi:hypothetical protein